MEKPEDTIDGLDTLVKYDVFLTSHTNFVLGSNQILFQYTRKCSYHDISNLGVCGTRDRLLPESLIRQPIIMAKSVIESLRIVE